MVREKNAISVGYETHSIGEASVALGTSTVASGFSASEITALQTEKTRLESVLTDINMALQSAIDELTKNVGKVSIVEMKFRVGQLHCAKAKAEQELNRISADLNRTSANSMQSTQSAIAIGNSARANNINATAIGRSTVASEANSIVLGRTAGVTGVNSTMGMAIGDAALISGDSAVDSIAVGHCANIKQNSSNAIAIGASASVVGDVNGSSGSIAIGHNTAAGNKNASWGKNASRELGYLAAQNATAVGTESVAGGTNSTAFGYKNVINTPNSGALGFNNTVGNYSNPQYNNNVASANYNGTDSFVVGANNNVTANNTVVFGNNVTVNSQGTNRTGAVVLGDNSTVPAEVKAVNSAKIGTTDGSKLVYSGFAGNLNGADTDVIHQKLQQINRVVLFLVGNATSPRQVKFVAAGEISATSTNAINNGADVTYNVEKGEFNATTTTSTISAKDDDNKVKAAAVGDVSDAINRAYWKAKAAGNGADGNAITNDTPDQVTAGTEVTYKAGKNLTVDHTTPKTFTFATVDTPNFKGGELVDKNTATNKKLTLTPTDEDGLKLNKGTDTAAKITNVVSGLDKYAVDKPLIGNGYTATDLEMSQDPTYSGLTNLADKSVQDNTAATVGDLRGLGWVVSSNKTTDNLKQEYTA